MPELAGGLGGVLPEVSPGNREQFLIQRRLDQRHHRAALCRHGALGQPAGNLALLIADDTERRAGPSPAPPLG